MSSQDETITIKRIEISVVAVPMLHPFTTSFGTVKDKATVLAHVYTDQGPEGWGEGSALPFPFYKPDTTDTTFLALAKYIGPALLGKKLGHPADILHHYQAVKGHNFAKTAVETAIWMVYSQLKQQSLATLLGGTHTAISVGESIGIHDSLEGELEEIALRIKEGYRRIKVKIKPGWDVRVVQAIRERFGDVELMVDGNSAYTLADRDILRELDTYNLTMIEQPLADDDIIDHAALAKYIRTPICLDESILSVEDARKAIEIGACKIINIKPGRVGGLTVSKQIHDLCQERGIGVWCGGMLETGIGRAYNIAVSSLPNYIYPADMSPNNVFYAEDLIDPTYTVGPDGTIPVPAEPGLGYRIMEDRIRRYTRETLTLA